MEDLTFVPSGRGGRKALYSGYIYTKHRNDVTGSSWHCIERHSGCKGRFKLNADDNGLRVVKEHNHLPDFGAVNAAKLVAKAKKRCLEEPNVLPSIVSQETYSNADNDTIVALPRERSIKAAIRRLRRKENPPLPASLADL